MKKLLYISLFFSSCLVAQNLVPNPSFEQYTSCPDNLCQIHRAIGWSSWNSTSDYYYDGNVCPLSSTTYQIPATGNAYAGIVAYENPAWWREYIGIQLSSTLTIGQKYYVSGKFSLLEFSQYACNNLGFLFSTVSYALDSVTACSGANVNPPQNFAHVFSSQIISDTLNWVTISGSFTADSSYQYIVVGNHFNDANTTTLLLDSSGCCAAYYLVDDIFVSTDSTLSVNDFDLGKAIIISPNPAREQITIYGRDIQNEQCMIKIFNSLGILVAEQSVIFKESVPVLLNNLSPSIYLLNINISNKILSKKIIINN